MRFLILLAVLAFLISAGTALATPTLSRNSDDAQMQAFLEKSRQTEICVLQGFQVSQNQKPLPCFIETGQVDKNLPHAGEPILSEFTCPVPFVRQFEMTVRMNRTMPVDLKWRVELVSRGANGELLHRLPENVYGYGQPGMEEQKILPTSSGEFILTLPQSKPLGLFRIQVRSGNERHEIALRLFNDKKPFQTEDKE